MARLRPFPGVDPWLQSFWGNVHTTMSTYACDLLNEQLAPGLVAVMQQRVLTENCVGAYHSACPDVRPTEHLRPDARSAAAVAGPGTSDEPIVIEMPADVFEQPYIEIVDAQSGGTVVTVIEVVSPSNKRAGEGRDLYVQKQDEVVASAASLVEIDLTRGFRGVTLAWRHSASVALEADYRACTRRATRRRALEVYPIGLRQRLPSLRIPLRPGEADIRLDLTRVLDDTYRRGRLGELINYARPPEPPLPDADARWAAEQVAVWQRDTGVA